MQIVQSPIEAEASHVRLLQTKTPFARCVLICTTFEVFLLCFIFIRDLDKLVVKEVKSCIVNTVTPFQIFAN